MLCAASFRSSVHSPPAVLINLRSVQTITFPSEPKKTLSFRKWPTSGRDYDPAPAKRWADCCQEKQHRYRIYYRRLFSQPSPKSGPDCDPLPEKRLAECSCPKGPIQHLSKKTLVPTYLYSTKAVQGAGSEPVPTLEPDLCISTAKEMLPGQEDWFQSGTDIKLKIYSHHRLRAGLSRPRTK